MPLSDIVNVVITKTSRPVARASFGIPLILTANADFLGRVAYFSDAASAKAALIGTPTVETAQIDAFFSQTPTVSQIALGAARASKTFVFTENSVSGGTISVTVNGTVISKAWSTDFDGTLTALASDIAAHADVDTAAYTAGTNTLVVTPNTGKVVYCVWDFSAMTGGVPTVATTCTDLNEAAGTALDACKAYSDLWYGLVTASRTAAYQLAAAVWTEAQTKIYIAVSADANIVDQTAAGDSTTIAHSVDAANYARTAVIYHSYAASQAADAAALGAILPLDPGSYTLKFKTLVGCTADALSTTQETNAFAKNANLYQAIGGVDILRNGSVGDGEWVDNIIFIDWLVSNIQSNVYATLIGNDKVPFTDQGIALVKIAIEQPLKAGQAVGGISPKSYDTYGAQNGGYSITVPSASAVSTADKTARSLTGVRFQAWLAGAVHAITINGNVSV